MLSVRFQNFISLEVHVHFPCEVSEFGLVRMYGMYVVLLAQVRKNLVIRLVLYASQNCYFKVVYDECQVF